MTRPIRSTWTCWIAFVWVSILPATTTSPYHAVWGWAQSGSTDPVLRLVTLDRGFWSVHNSPLLPRLLLGSVNPKPQSAIPHLHHNQWIGLQFPITDSDSATLPWRIRHNGETVLDGQVRFPPQDPGQPFCFVFLADLQIDYNDHIPMLVSMVQEQAPDASLLLLTGDLVKLIGNSISAIG